MLCRVNSLQAEHLDPRLGIGCLQEAIAPVSREQAEMLKPRFHITGATGWINDPNGMFQNKDGSYHVFYQVSSCRPGRLSPTPRPVLMHWFPACIWQASQPVIQIVCCMVDDVFLYMLYVFMCCTKALATCSGIRSHLSGERLIGVRCPPFA